MSSSFLHFFTLQQKPKKNSKLWRQNCKKIKINLQFPFGVLAILLFDFINNAEQIKNEMKRKTTINCTILIGKSKSACFIASTCMRVVSSGAEIKL